jgi:hypothetical protein
MGMILVKPRAAIVEIDTSGCTAADAADKDKTVMELIGREDIAIVDVTGHATLCSNLDKVLFHADRLCPSTSSAKDDLTHLLQFLTAFMAHAIKTKTRYF